MQRTWKYRLYPTASQASELERQLAVACDLYNAAFEQRVWAWRRDRVSITFREQSKQLAAAWLLGATGIASKNGGSEAGSNPEPLLCRESGARWGAVGVRLHGRRLLASPATRT